MTDIISQINMEKEMIEQTLVMVQEEYKIAKSETQVKL